MDHTHVEPPKATPQTGVHPEQVDPLGRNHRHEPMPEDEKRLLFVLAVSLVAAIILVPITSAMSQSPFVNVFLGLSPIIFTLIIDIYATSQHFKATVYWVVLITVHLLAIAILWLLSQLLPTPINVPNAVTVSLLLGVIITALLTLLVGRSSTPAEHSSHTVAFKPERIQEYVQSIEDKVKAINFVIGRVYRSSNGGTVKMRERLRIPSEWYNEFHLVKDEELSERLENAKVLIRKIRDRLAVYAMKESEVFSQQELSALKHLARRKDGEDPIIMVLKTNDRDPVEHYYVSAVEFCDRILEELDKKTQ
jgi:hypothetical protein